MSIEIRVPDEQEGTKAVVRAWLKQVGDVLSRRVVRADLRIGRGGLGLVE